MSESNLIQHYTGQIQLADLVMFVLSPEITEYQRMDTMVYCLPGASMDRIRELAAEILRDAVGTEPDTFRAGQAGVQAYRVEVDAEGLITWDTERLILDVGFQDANAADDQGGA